MAAEAKRRFHHGFTMVSVQKSTAVLHVLLSAVHFYLENHGRPHKPAISSMFDGAEISVSLISILGTFILFECSLKGFEMKTQQHQPNVVTELTTQPLEISNIHMARKDLVHVFCIHVRNTCV